VAGGFFGGRRQNAGGEDAVQEPGDLSILDAALRMKTGALTAAVNGPFALTEYRTPPSHLLLS
jgi:hypothetical protein